MKIRQRLALLFTFAFFLLTGAILVFIYILTRGFVHADFVERLTQQSSLEALHFASPHVKDVMPPGSFNLVNPASSIFTEDGALVYKNGSYDIPRSWIEYLKHNPAFNAERGQYTTVGRRHDINGKRYLVFVSDKDLPGQHELNILVKAMIVGWIVGLMLSYLAGLYFSGNALQPVKRVVKEVNQINEENLSFRLGLNKEGTTADEIDELVLTFNALLTRIESAFKAQQRFVQNASHELKTPLTAIMAEAELALARDRHVSEYKRTLEVVMLETERLVRITQGLLTLARFEEGSYKSSMENVYMPVLLSETLGIFKLHYPDREVVREGEVANVYVLGNSQLLQIVLLNVLDNAVKYSKEKIIIRVSSSTDEITVGIQDFGIGIPADELHRIRAPLFRASNVREIQGSGLGLSLAERIVRIHGGSLDLTSEEGRGTYCIIKLPTEKLD